MHGDPARPNVQDVAMMEVMEQLFSESHRADTAGLLIVRSAQSGVRVTEWRESYFLSG